MNSAHEKLFVRRKCKTKVKVYRDVQSNYNGGIKTVAPINENILLNGTTGEASYEKLLETDNAESLHKELKPQLIVLRLFGCFPVYFSKSG
jgi:acetoin utilization deacetylase AcuC-like enzyme